MINRVFLLLIFVNFSALALDDSSENRLQQAERYIAAVPPEAIMKDVTNSVSMNFSPEKSKEFRARLLEYLNIKTLSRAMKASMVKAFTADELAALADFHEMPIAKSAMQKMGLYMADVMPTVHAEIKRAVSEMEDTWTEKNRIPSDVQE